MTIPYSPSSILKWSRLSYKEYSQGVYPFYEIAAT